MIGKWIGSTLIVTGTAVGAGMLALPIASAGAGFSLSVLLLIVLWALMTYTALLILEVVLALKQHQNSFHSMASATLGFPGKAIAWVTCLLLLYALTCAYISGASSLLSELVAELGYGHLPGWLGSVLFTVVFGGFVCYSTRAVDILNRGLMSVKGLALIIALILLFPKVNITQLHSTQADFPYIWAAAPIFLTAFGFHTVIPSIVNYIGPKPRVIQWILIVGAFIPLVLYIFWLICTLGIIPRTGNDSFQYIAGQHDNLGTMLQQIFFLAQSKAIQTSINFFANIAMTTSFLGVTLGLFDFLADGFNRPNTRSGRFQTALLTFVLPFVFALFYPQGFIMALGYAAIFVAILEIILPALMVYQLRRGAHLHSPYRVYGGTIALAIVFLLGVVLIGIQIAYSYHLLPVLSG